VGRGGRESHIPHTVPNSRRGVSWSCEYLCFCGIGDADDRFPFPIRIDRIKPIMSDHFSKYGSIRAIQPREMANEAATKAVVVFWVSLPELRYTQLTSSPLNQSRIVSQIPTGSTVSPDLTQLHPGSTSTLNPSLLRPQQSISK
jgi:hypothetical protein